MGASLWNQVWLPLLIGLAIQILVAALCILSARLCNCLMKQIKTGTAVGERAHDQPRPESGAAAHANGTPDLEMGNGSGGPAEGRESMDDPEMELGIVNSGELAPKAQVIRVAARGALVRPVEINGRSSFPARGSKLIMVLQEWQPCGQCSVPFNLRLVTFG